MDTGNSSSLPSANTTSTDGMYLPDTGAYPPNMTLTSSNFMISNISVANGDIMGVATGQVSSVGDVLAAIMSNPDITSDLGTDAISYLHQLAATPSVASAALPDTVSSTLSSPGVDVSILLSQIADFAGTVSANLTVTNSTGTANSTMSTASNTTSTGKGVTDVASTPSAAMVNSTSTPAKVPLVTAKAGPAASTNPAVSPSAAAPATAAPVQAAAPVAPTGSALPTSAAPVLTLLVAVLAALCLSSMP
ncbi:MAG: hypothetical protein WDW38_002397 [Sanguina aurantia]